MAFTKTTQLDPYVDNLIVDTDANRTVQQAILGGSAATIYIIDIDNTNTGAASVFKAYNNANPTLDGSANSTEPDIIITAPKNVRQTVTIRDGVNLPSDFSFALVTGASTTNYVSPAQTTAVRIMAE
tara:strand:+ start:220 stop:600 length:381 start_codon:yes stop_codon:yes gene_type:complete